MADKAADAADDPKCFSMTYEEVVRVALEWALTGEDATDEEPL